MGGNQANRWIALVAAFGSFSCWDAAAQVSVRVNGADVEVQSGSTGVAVTGNRVWTNVPGGTSTRSGGDTVIQRSYQSSGGTAIQRSYQSQSADGDSYGDWNIGASDLASGRYFLVLEAPPGRSLGGRVRFNGALLPVAGRQRLVVPLAGRLRTGPNLLTLMGVPSNTLVGLAGTSGSWPAYLNGRLVGANRTWMSQTTDAPNRTLVLTVGE